MPPVDRDLAAARDTLVDSLQRQGVPTLVQLAVGETLGAQVAPPETIVVDLLEPLLARRLEALDAVARNAVVVWPSGAALTDDEAMWDEGCRRLRAAGAACVQASVLELGPAERRELAGDERGEALYSRLFHGRVASERRFAAVASRHGLDVFFRRRGGERRSQSAQRRRRRAAGAGRRALARLGRGEAQGQELFRASRWVEDTADRRAGAGRRRKSRDRRGAARARRRCGGRGVGADGSVADRRVVAGGVRRSIDRLVAASRFVPAASTTPEARTIPATPMPLQQGTRLGHYRVTGRVGAGGMGEVYRAHDENLGRDVALKILTDRLVGSAELDERFEREARAVAALSHPNILVIHDFGREGATAYAVSELLEGETLRQRLEAQSPLPPRQAIAIARDIARGLAAAHEKRIVHRDIKPANVFLTAGGAVKILDFGLARSHDAPADPLAETLPAPAAGGPARAGAAVELTTPGELMGTAGYMSPEQVRGEVATPRSDVFALGCVLHEMLSGRSPFVRASKADTLAAILVAEAPALTALGAKLPRSVATVLTKCLAKDPSARYADASPLLTDLDGICREIEGPPRIEARSIVASLRRPAIAVPLLLVVAAAAFGIYRWNERQARESWARRSAIPEAQRLMGENRWFEAWELAVQARAVLDNDPALEALWPQVTTPLRVTTNPAGATVAYRPYRSASPSAAWRTLGQTPYRDDHFPVGAFRFRIEKEGFEAVEVARSLLTGDWIESSETQGLGYPGMPVTGSTSSWLRPAACPRACSRSPAAPTYRCRSSMQTCGYPERCRRS